MYCSFKQIAEALSGHVIYSPFDPIPKKTETDGIFSVSRHVTGMDIRGILILESADMYDPDFLCIAQKDICAEILKAAAIGEPDFSSPETCLISAGLPDVPEELMLPGHIVFFASDLSLIKIYNSLSTWILNNLATATVSSTPHLISFQHLFPRISESDGSNEERLTASLGRLSPAPKTYMRLILIRFDLSWEDQQAALEYTLLPSVRQFFPTEHIAVMARDIVVLISSDELHCPLKFSMEKFEEFLAANQALAMVSNPFVSITAMRVMYAQCLRMFPIALAVRQDSEGRCLTFARYTQYNIIDICSVAHDSVIGASDIVILCHPGVMTITRYDRANGTNLRDIMFYYLLNDRSITKTAAQMFMHRNTILYKIKKIEELLGESMDDPYLRHNLIFSCMLLRYREIYQKEGVALSPYVKGSGKKRK